MTNDPHVLRHALAIGEAMLDHEPGTQLLIVPRTKVLVIKANNLVQLSEVFRILRGLGYSKFYARKANFEKAFFLHVTL